jgi:3-isopropylmalate dehydrogenase
MTTYRVAYLPGDGVGPEVLAEARRAVDATGAAFGFDVAWDEHVVGGAAIDHRGTALEDATLAACRDADAVLLGAVGGPRWDHPRAAVRPEQALLRLRSELELFANLRPVRAVASLASASPVRPEVRDGTDVLIVRELTGGLYFGRPQGRTDDGAVDTCAYSREEVERVVRLACELATSRRGRVTSVDKANVLATGRLWREVATDVAAEFPGITVEHSLVDSFAADLIRRPTRYDVVVTGERVRRHPVRRGRGARGFARPAPVGERRHRDNAARPVRAVRARPRERAGHRGTRRGESGGRDRLGGADAALVVRRDRGSERPR